MSYHDNIQAAARKIENQRAKIYSKTGQATIVWTERELLFIYAIIYKVLRVKGMTKDRAKAIDDIMDIYNYAALLYEEVLKNGGT
jgi:hypothetical protein